MGGRQGRRALAGRAGGSVILWADASVRCVGLPRTGPGTVGWPWLFQGARWPALIVLAGCAGLTGVAMASGAAPLYGAVLLGLAAYLVASQLPRRMSIPPSGQPRHCSARRCGTRHTRRITPCSQARR